MTERVTEAIHQFLILREVMDSAAHHITFAPLVAVTKTFSTEEWAAYYDEIGKLQAEWIPERIKALKERQLAWQRVRI